MIKYILDTNIIRYLEDDNSHLHKPIIQHLSMLNNEDKVYLSVLRYLLKISG